MEICRGHSPVPYALANLRSATQFNSTVQSEVYRSGAIETDAKSSVVATGIGDYKLAYSVAGKYNAAER